MESKRQGLYVRIGFAAITMWLISVLIRSYGLYEQVYFNKGIISIVSFVLAFTGAKRSWHCLKRDFRTAGIACFTAFLLWYTELCGIGMRLQANHFSVAMSGSDALCILGSAVCFAFLTIPFFVILFQLELQKAGSDESAAGCEIRKSFFLAWGMLFVSYIPCLLAFYPGLYCYDMSWQWEMVVANNYSTHHPLIHTWLSGTLFELGKQWLGSYNAGMILYVLVQLVFFSGCMAFALAWLRKLGISRKIRMAITCFYMLFPFFAVLGVSTTKDVYFGGFFLLVFVCVCDMVRSQKLYCGWRLLLFVAAIILMGLLRNNAVYGVAFMVACVLLTFAVLWGRGRKAWFLLQLAVVFSAASLGTLVLFGVLETRFHANKGSVAELLSVPCQQLARTYIYHGSELRPEDREELFAYIPEEYLKRYKYYVSDPVKAGLDVNHLNGDEQEFARLWGRIGMEFPLEYVQATAYNTMGLWYLGGDSSSSVVYDMREFFDDVHTFEKHSLFPLMEQYYRWFTDANIQSKLPAVSVIFYTSFYAWLVVIGIAAILQKRRYRMLLPAMLLTGYMLTLVLGPCIMVRYMLNIILCVPIFTCCIYSNSYTDFTQK